MDTSIFLNQAVFDYPCFPQSFGWGDEKRINRSYTLLQHAESLIQADTNELHAADAISNLKRAIGIRLRLLDEYYEFSTTPMVKKKGLWEVLKHVGIVRPFFIQQLFDFRNRTEHDDAAPPEIPKILELIDLTWYFLKSTDTIVRNPGHDLIFASCVKQDKTDEEEWLEVGLASVQELRLSVQGVMPFALLSSPTGWRITTSEMRLVERPKITSPLFISGEIIGYPEAVHKFWSRIFANR